LGKHIALKSRVEVNMADDCKNLLIIGATGLIGRRIIQEIVRNKSKFDRIAIFTSQSTLESKSDDLDKLKQEGVEVIGGDVSNPDDVKKAYQGKAGRPRCGRNP
jgi:uncharacterized protein YbjT (DUF2867 family)